MAPRKVEFANFVLTFGTKYNLHDFLDDIVLPALTQEKKKRSFMGHDYFFIDLELLDLGTTRHPQPAIAGRFVDDTLLVREQVYKEGKVVPDRQKMRSSPSSIFVLLLESHKLVFYHETRDAPTVAQFRTTCEKLLVEKYMDWMGGELQRRTSIVPEGLTGRELRTCRSKKGIKAEIPPPTLSIVPLSSNASLADFVKRFSVLQEVRVELESRTNNEIDNDPFFDELREKKREIRSQKTALVHRNSGGLDQDAAIRQLSAAVQEGNTRVSMHGNDDNGRLDGDNHTFKLRIPMANVPSRITAAAEVLVAKFNGLVDDGTLKLAEIEDRAKEEMRRIRDRFRRP